MISPIRECTGTEALEECPLDRLIGSLGRHNNSTAIMLGARPERSAAVLGPDTGSIIATLLYKMKKGQGIVRRRKGAFIDDQKSKIATRVEQKSEPIGYD